MSMAKELKLPPENLFEQYCEVYIGYDYRIPVVRPKPRGSIKRCPLLKNRKYMVHRAKTTVCAMYPLGGCIVASSKKKVSRISAKVSFNIFLIILGMVMVWKHIQYKVIMRIKNNCMPLLISRYNIAVSCFVGVKSTLPVSQSNFCIKYID